MGWIRNMRARQEERERLYKSIEINAKSLLVLIKVPPARVYGYETLNEEIRGIYREFLDQGSRLGKIGNGTVSWVEIVMYGTRIRDMARNSNNWLTMIKTKIYGLAHTPSEEG
ncbi:hypothetical protein D3C78_337700 [compost metagenome]